MDNKDIDNARKDAIVGRAEAEKQNALDKAREQFSQFDMSKVKNKDALAEQDPGALDVPQVKKSNKFFFSDVDTITLPSGGYLYRNSTNDEDILKGLIKMKSMTVAEEKILTTQRYIKAGITTRVILDRCIESNIDAKDILVYDSNYLMFYLRQISYGDKYEFEITCGNLGCEKKFDHQVEISKLNFETLPEDIIEPIKIELPRSKYTVYMVLTRLHHLEKYF